MRLPENNVSLVIDDEERAVVTQQLISILTALLGALALGLLGLSASWTSPVTQPRVPANDLRIPVLTKYFK